MPVQLTGSTLPGTIHPYGGSTAPAGWLLCDGTSYSVTTYPALAAILNAAATGGAAYAYGGTLGVSFNVPDFRGQFLRGVSGSTSNDPDRASRSAQTTGGNSGNNVGSTQGHQLFSHTHTAASENSDYGAGFAPANMSLTTATCNGFNGGPGTITPTTNTSIQNFGGNETRPTNSYVTYIIKT